MTSETVPELLSRTAGQASRLISGLAELAAAEVGAGFGNIAKGIGALLTGLAVASIGLLFLLHAAVAYLVLRGFTEASSYAIVGGGALGLAIIIMIVGALLLRNGSPVPRRALGEIQALLGQRSE